MLKRQRQQTPPPSRPTIAEPTDDNPIVSRDAKRQRTLPPVLDGASRGWNVYPGDEEEEQYSSEDGGYSPVRPYQHVAMSEYSATNSVLRELHILNQHRIIFSHYGTRPPPGSPSASRNVSDQYSPYPSLHPLTKVQTFPGYQESPSPSYLSSASVVGDELSHVQKHYEGTNKLLGELFLSRRRETGASNAAYPS